MKNLDRIIGSRLRTRRKELSLSQWKLARLAGIRATAISEIERGAVRRSSCILELAQALNINPEWLMGRTEDMSPKKAEIEISEILSEFSEGDKEEAVRLIKAWASVKREAQKP